MRVRPKGSPSKPPLSRNRLKILVAALCLAAALGMWAIWRKPAKPLPVASMSKEELIKQGLPLLAEQEKRADKEYWEPELQAQQWGRAVDAFWDRLNGASNKLETAKALEADVVLPVYNAAEHLPHGIEVFRPVEREAGPLAMNPPPLSSLPPGGGEGVRRTGLDWASWLDSQIAAGWLLERVEFRHNAFTPTEGAKASSVYYFSAHLVNDRVVERAILEGNLKIEWVAGKPVQVDASQVELRRRKGPAAFAETLFVEAAPPPGSFFIDPLIVRDFDGDQKCEIALTARNEVYKQTAEGEWRVGPLCRGDVRLIFTGLIDDFDGDGIKDFLCANFDGLQLWGGENETKEFAQRTPGPAPLPPYLFSGAAAAGAGVRPSPGAAEWGGEVTLEKTNLWGLQSVAAPGDGRTPLNRHLPPGEEEEVRGRVHEQQMGSFPGPPRQVWAAAPRLRYAQAIASGDIDGDGDLDLFLGQYKLPYHQGQMPTPYFDAHDGNPSFLLLNDGQGQFTDVTRAAGLGPKQFRRVYSASFADLDGDSDLDLLVISDFAGADVWANDGQGRFTLVTQEWLGESWGFGMSQTFADFNADGVLDLLMIGMNSPTADRLDHLKLKRPYVVPDDGMRAKLAFGNRLWLGQSGKGFVQQPLHPALTRTGWAWGAAAGDLDNDGFPDLYIVNGHDSKQSVQEYEPEFYLHDIYVGNSQENALIHAYFQQKSGRTRGRGHSYGGYEKNRFLLNRSGTNFVEVAHLFGLGLEEDGRNVLAEDLNNDGKLDLIVTTFEVWPKTRQTLRVFENRLPEVGNWFGVDVSSAPVGSKVALPGKAMQQIVTGAGYRSQGSGRLHFGVGKGAGPFAVQIEPHGGKKSELQIKINAWNRAGE